jgi:hypothetical protein
MIPCRDCPQRYIGQTSKKIETRITEHKNAIKRYDLRSLPAAHTYDNCHTFNWTHTELLGQAQTKHAREFKEAWHSMDNNTINRHVDIPTIYLQLKMTPNASTNNNTNTNLPTTLPHTSTNSHSNHSNDTITKEINPTLMHPVTTNEMGSSSSERPIRRSRRIQELKQQRENSN